MRFHEKDGVSATRTRVVNTKLRNMADSAFDPISPNYGRNRDIIIRSGDGAVNHTSDNTSSASATTYNTQQSVSSLSTLSIDARARRGLDVESEGFKLTHNDEYFSEIATKVVALLTDNPKSSDVSDVALLRQHYGVEFLRLFAKALVFRMKIIKALRAGSLAQERRVDALTERCYTRLGLGNSDSVHILLKNEVHDQPVTHPQNYYNGQRSVGSSTPSEKSSLNVVGGESKWPDINRPASPIRIRQPSSKRNLDRKVRVNFDLPDSSTTHSYNPNQPLNFQHGPGGDQMSRGSTVSNPAMEMNGPPFWQHQPMPSNNIGGRPDGYFPSETMISSMISNSSPRHQRQQYSSYNSINGKNTMDGVLSPNPGFKRGKTHALVDDEDSSEAESVGRKEDLASKSAGSWKHGSAIRINDGSAIRINGEGSTAYPVVDGGGSAKVSPPDDEDEKDAFVPLQTISFGSKQKQHNKKNTATSPVDTLPAQGYYPNLSVNTQAGVQYPISVKSSTSSVSKADGLTVDNLGMTQLLSARSPNEKIREGSTTSPTKKGSDVHGKISFLEAVDLPMTKVVAPANLPEGYTFEARVGNKRFLATVPTGGVSKGDTFFTYVRELERVDVSVPVGEWRDDLCDCCAFGPLHPLFLNACLCPHIALGQIMSRSGLDYKGRTAPTFISRQTCSTIIIIVATYLSLNAMIFILATNDYIVYGDYPPSWQLTSCFVALNIVFIVYTYYTIGATRASLRSKYMISERRCGRYEDCCCALFCTFCTITQMGRHTGDYHTFRGVCCNSSGLPQHVTIPRNPDAMFYEKMHDVDASNKLVI